MVENKQIIEDLSQIIHDQAIEIHELQLADYKKARVLKILLS